MWYNPKKVFSFWWGIKHYKVQMSRVCYMSNAHSAPVPTAHQNPPEPDRARMIIGYGTLYAYEKFHSFHLGFKIFEGNIFRNQKCLYNCRRFDRFEPDGEGPRRKVCPHSVLKCSRQVLDEIGARAIDRSPPRRLQKNVYHKPEFCKKGEEIK